MPGSERQNNMFSASPLDFKQKGNPFTVTSCGRRRNTGGPLRKADPRRTIGKGKNFNKVSKNKSARGGAAGGGMTEKGVREYKRKKSNEPRKTTKGKGRNFRTVKEGAGMTAKGVAEYRRKNPGSKLKTAVTGKVKPGSKAAKRRKSFCARSKSWTSERGKAARRRWKC